MDPRFDDPRITTVGLLHEAQAVVGRALAGSLEREGLSPQWFEVLLRLGRTPGNRLRMADLAAMMTSITPSGLTRLVDRMEGAGLVAREQCAEDRRGSFAVLTDLGSRRLADVIPSHLVDIDRVLGSALEPHEQEQLVGLLRKLRDAHCPGPPAGCD